MNYEKQIDQYLRDHLQGYLQEITKLCAQPSISSTGEGVQECACMVQDLLNAHDIDTSHHQTSGFPIIVGKGNGEKEKTLLFYNHYDVQPPEPLDLWDSPPFDPIIREGKLFARGSRDDKGEFISRLAAVDAVRATYGSLPCNVTFLLEGEEECGSPNLAKFVQDHLNLLQSDGAIWEEGYVEVGEHPTLLLGVRGILYVELEIKTMNADAHSGNAHALPNAAWKMNCALNSIRNCDFEILIPGFYDAVREPTKEELRLFDEWPDIELSWKKQYGVENFNNNLKGNDLRRAVFEPTCNLDGFSSGHQGPGTKTVIPSRATVKLDFRLVPNQDPEDIYQKLREHLNKEGFYNVDIKILGKMKPYMTSIDDPLVKLTLRAGYGVYGKKVLVGPISGWSSPMYSVAVPLDIPVVNPGIGYWDNCSHAPNEHIRLKDFINGARHIARIIVGFGSINKFDK